MGNNFKRAVKVSAGDCCDECAGNYRCEFMEERSGLLERLKTDGGAGLTSGQAAENAVKFGINSFTRQKPDSLFKRIFQACMEPMILLLITAGFIALSVDIIYVFYKDESPNFYESIGVFAAIALSVIITVVMEGRSAKAFEALNKINEDITVKAIRNGKPLTLHKNEIVAGDILLLATGDSVPADGRLLESTSLSTDEAALTGESLPVKKDANVEITDEKTTVAERFNMLYSGTYVTNGFCKMVVTAVGDNTEFGKIAKALTGVNSGSTPLQEKLRKLGKRIAIFGISVSALVFIVLLLYAWRDGLLDLSAGSFVKSRLRMKVLLNKR